MVKSIAEIMTTRIETIGLEDNAQEAARKMKHKNVSSLVVVDKNEPEVGIVTIDPNSSVETAANVMMQNKVRHLVVVNEKKTLGIITATNFVNYLNRHLDLDDVNARILSALSEEPSESQSATS